jgi:hypothetical protein
MEELLSKKEYYSLKIEPTNDEYDDSDLFDDSLLLQSYQVFGKNFINPNTKNERLLAKWQTGSGKSLFALSVANEFIKYFKTFPVKDSPSIFIIGFSNALPRELLKFPELGIITHDEHIELMRLRRIALSGLPNDVRALKDFKNRIKHRIRNKEAGGYFVEYGYQQFVYRLFEFIDDVDIFRTQSKTINEADIDDLIKAGKLRINTTLLESMKNSLIICDEIHNTYNTEKKNNWGVALQYALDYHKNKGNRIFAIFMTATPINNSPSEIIDMLNLLLSPGKKLQKNQKLHKYAKIMACKIAEI